VTSASAKKRNIVSVKALAELLRRVIQNPGEFVNEQTLCRALKSQGALAKYSSDVASILPTSINTLKRLADENLEGGWTVLDGQRRNALDAVSAHEEALRQGNKATKSALKNRLDEREKQLGNLRQVNYGLLKALGRMCIDISQVGALENALDRQKLVEESIARLKGSLALNLPPFDKVPKDENPTVRRIV